MIVSLEFVAIALTLSGVPQSAPSTQPASQPTTQPAMLPRLKPAAKIVAMGDSITQAGGYLRAIDAVFAQQYADMHLAPIINVGVSGEKAEDMLRRFQRDVIDKKPDLVTISVGVNDVWHRLEKPHDPAVLTAYAENVEKMVRMASKAGARVILLAPTIIQEDPTSEGNRRLAMYVEAGKKVAAKCNCEYVDLHAMFLKAIENQQARGASRDEATNLTSDGVHMRPMGDTIMAIGVLRALGVPDEKIVTTDLGGVFADAPHGQ